MRGLFSVHPLSPCNDISVYVYCDLAPKHTAPPPPARAPATFGSYLALLADVAVLKGLQTLTS